MILARTTQVATTALAQRAQVAGSQATEHARHRGQRLPLCNPVRAARHPRALHSMQRLAEVQVMSLTFWFAPSACDLSACVECIAVIRYECEMRHGKLKEQIDSFDWASQRVLVAGAGGFHRRISLRQRHGRDYLRDAGRH